MHELPLVCTCLMDASKIGWQRCFQFRKPQNTCLCSWELLQPSLIKPSSIKFCNKINGVSDQSSGKPTNNSVQEPFYNGAKILPEPTKPASTKLTRCVFMKKTHWNKAHFCRPIKYAWSSPTIITEYIAYIMKLRPLCMHFRLDLDIPTHIYLHFVVWIVFFVWVWYDSIA